LAIFSRYVEYLNGTKITQNVEDNDHADGLDHLISISRKSDSCGFCEND
jgi:hypothetical protein